MCSPKLPAVVVLVLLAACGGSDGGSGSTPTAPPNNTPASVSISPSSGTLTFLGATLQLQATVRNSSGTVVSANISWSSASANIATVSSSGVVSAVAQGAATITAQAGSASSTAAITVSQLATSVTKLTGDAQTADAQTTLPELIQIEVRDQGGSTIEGASVTWIIVSGGGSVQNPTTTTDAQGQASGQWVLGETIGEQRLRVEASSSVAAEFMASALDPTLVRIESVSPGELIEGSAATIDGRNFGTDAGALTVTLDGVQMLLTSVTDTRIQATVPAFDCFPRRTAPLVVAVGGQQAEAQVIASPGVDPLVFDVGAGFVTDDVNCLRLAGGGVGTEYLIGIMSTIEVPSAVVTANLVGRESDLTSPQQGVSSNPLASIRIEGFRTQAVRSKRPISKLPPTLRDDRISRQFRAQALVEAEIWKSGQEILQRFGLPPKAVEQPHASALAGPLAVGSQVLIRVPIDCFTSDLVSATLQGFGDDVFWFTDDANPVQLSLDQIAALDATYSSGIAGALDEFFGPDNDLDQNGRTVVLITRKVNEVGALGFVHSADQEPACPGGNGGVEIFYGVAPDPNGVLSETPFSVDEIIDLYPPLMAHEITHIRQFANQNNPARERWEFEGGATLAELLIGPIALGQTRVNLGFAETVAAEPSWYELWHQDVSFFSGSAVTGGELSGRVSDAPNLCTWIGNPEEGNTGPCLNPGRAIYGMPATIFLWLVDAVGPSYSGGEQALVRDITAASTAGLSTISQIFGQSVTVTMASFYIEFYLATRGGTAFTSFDLEDIFTAIPSTQVQPAETFTSKVPDGFLDVRGGSIGYIEWKPASGHQDAAFALRTLLGGSLPAGMNFWVFRTN